MHVLVTGANGQLGSEIRANADRKARYFFTDADVLDITQIDEIRSFVHQNHIGLIVNCAAYTNVDKAEDDTAVAESINHTAVAHLATVCAEVSIPLIHISTDYVFGGNGNTPYTEADNTCPLGVYGRTKLAGEQAIQQAGIEHLIIRTAWLYSLQFGHNFVKTIQRLSRERNELKVVFDQVGSPTNAADLAEAILSIVCSDRFEGGVYHYSNEGVCSWYDFAKAIFELARIDCRVLPIESSQYPTPAKRPHYSVLNKAKIKSVYGIHIPYWRDSLQRVISSIKDN